MPTPLLLAEELRRCKCPIAPQRVQQIIIEAFNELYPGESTESLIADTPKADRWVRQVWERLGYRVPHKVINLTLFNLRKRSQLVPRSKRRLIDVT